MAAVATDAPGYLFDKLVTDATLTKTLVGTTPSAITGARVGFGRILGTDAGDVVDLRWFDKTA